MKTLDDLIKQYHMSRMTFERRMAEIPNFKTRFCTRGKYNKLLISDKGVGLINHEKHNSTSRAFHTKHGKNNGQLTKNDLVDVIHFLRDDLEKKDSQISSLKSNRNKQMELEYHKQRLPSPDEWKMQKDIDKRQQDYIKALKDHMNNMSLGEWLRRKFSK